MKFQSSFILLLATRGHIYTFKLSQLITPHVIRISETIFSFVKCTNIDIMARQVWEARMTSPQQIQQTVKLYLKRGSHGKPGIEFRENQKEFKAVVSNAVP